MAFGRGGKREGAGRKAKADKFEPQVAAAEQKIADRLPSLLDNMIHLADGGYERVEEKFERIIRKDANDCPIRDEKGNLIYDVVMVERKVSVADKDRAANEYLINRILGKPTERQEIDAEINGEIDVTLAARTQAEKELNEWRKAQNEALSNLRNAPPTSPT